MKKNTKPNTGFEELHEVKTAGFTATKKVKRDKTINRRAGLHDKLKNLKGEARVKRRKPLGLKHVRRMRKFAAVASIGVVGAIAVFGVGFFKPANPIRLDGEFETVCYVAPTDGTKPTDHTLVENVGYMNYVLQNQLFWSSYSHSDVDAVALGVPAKQSVDNYKQYYNKVLISADCSFSSVSKLLQYGEQFCQANGMVLSRYSTSNNTEDLNKGMDAPWSTGHSQGWTLKGFRANRGLPPYEFSVYVLNELTIANASDYSVVDNYDGTYSMKLKLNTNTGVDETAADYYYRLQMQKNGNLSDLPTIYWTTLTYTFDENWRVLSLEVDDNYSLKAVGISSNCSSHVLTTYDYSEEKAKNTIWEDYFKAEYERLKDTLIDESVDAPVSDDNAFSYLSTAFGSVMVDGAVFKVGLNIDNLNLNGVVNVEMEDGGFSGLTAKLGDILVWLDGNTLYINDGCSKYKVDTGSLLSGSTETQSLTDGFDLGALMNQMTDGEFTLNKETGIATLLSEVELFGLKVNMEFEFQKAEDGEISLNLLKAEIPLGEKVVKANLSFGTLSDKPAIPEDTSKYQDILNDGITFNISLNANGLTLDGIAKIIMQNGEFAGAYAELGDITVYLDYPHNMLYLSKGDLKYKLDFSAFGNGGADTLALLDSFDINSLLSDVLLNLCTTESSLGSTISINIDALETVLKAALDIQLFGGLKVDAGLTVDKLNLSVNAALTNEEVVIPDLTGYKDILNGEITLDVSLALLTGNDEVTLEGKVALCLAGGAVTEVRADFGGLAFYLNLASNTIYIKVGTTKVMINLAEMDLTGASIISTLDGGEDVADGLPSVIKEFLANLVGDGKIISANADLSILNAIVPVWAELDLSEGVSVRAGVTLLGIETVAKVAISETALEGLSAEEKEAYVDVLKEGHKIVESLIGNHVSATVEGTLYTGGEIKYGFTAAVEYDKGAISVDEDGVETDTKAYIHINIGLTAQQPTDSSLYLDLVLMDANPVTGADGKTTGGYTQDGKFDVYLSVSNRLDNPVPLNVYAPVDEILTLVAMAGATVNLDGITVENSKELTAAIAQISDLLDGMLISQYLPKSVQDKFASLGNSLIPQILGVSLEELLNGLFGTVDNTVKDAGEFNFLLSDEYVSSIRTTDESLIFVLNSSLIYNKEISTENNLTVTFDRVLKDGVYFVGGASLENVYFGENQENELDIGLKLGYDEIIRPDANSAFKGYLNADGLDALLNGFVNSATHKVEGTEDEYDLNHTYYLSGSITAQISVLSFINVSVTVDVKSLAVYIDPVTNGVYADVHLYFPKKALAINANTDTYMSFKNDMVYIKRVTSTTEYRIMTMNSFLADIMNQIVFITNLSDTISGYLQDMDMSGNSVNMDGMDYGKLLDYVLSSYVYNDSETSASWIFTLSNELLTDLVGMPMSSIPVTINADKAADGSYTVTGLSVASSGKPAEMTLVKNVVNLKLHGSFTYQNPHEVVNAGYENSAYYLADEKAVDGYSWSELLGGDTAEKILEAVNWARLLRETSGSTYLKYNGSNLHAGILKFEYSSDDTNTDFVEFGERQLVLYGNSSIYTRLTYPDANGVMPPVEVEGSTDKLVSVWDDYYTAISDGSGADIAMRARYNNLVIKYVSSQSLEGLIDYDFSVKNEDGYYVYSKTYAYSDEAVLKLSALSDLNTHIFLGYYDYGTGEELTQLSLNSSRTVFIDWLGKTVNVRYVSDLDVSSEAGDDGYYCLTNTVAYDKSDALITPNVSESNVEFLGWFIQNGESYYYIADANALKAYLSESFVVDGSTVELSAVWTAKIQVNVTSVSYSWWTLKANGSYSGGGFVDGMSSEIAQKAGITTSASVDMCSSDDGTAIKESWGGSLKADNSFSLSHSCGSKPAYAGAKVTVTYSANGTAIAENSETAYTRT